MKAKFLFLPLLLAPALGGCTSTSGDGYTTSSNAFETNINGNLHLDFDNGILVVKAPGRPDARIAADGDLQIDGKAVSLTPVQRALLKRYYSEVANVRDDGVTIGKAGAALGVNAVSNAIESLLSNDHAKNDADMQANSKKVEVAAQRLCSDMIQVKSTQGEIAAQLPALAQYAAFRGEVHCGKRVAETGRNSAAAPPQAQ
ncbi:MAG TPA: DUF2884 family protein [Rhodanobacteraceae bacterium]